MTFENYDRALIAKNISEAVRENPRDLSAHFFGQLIYDGVLADPKYWIYDGVKK